MIKKVLFSKTTVDINVLNETNQMKNLSKKIEELAAKTNTAINNNDENADYCFENKYINYLQEKFNDCIKELIAMEDVQKLNNFYQHMGTSRMQHVINVSYYSFLIAHKLKLDYKSCARAGLLHDLFLYDWRTTKFDEHHAFAHPKQSLINAKKITDVNSIEENAILSHMWPLSKKMPRYKEAFIVSLADKYCCIAEIGDDIFRRFRKLLFQ